MAWRVFFFSSRRRHTRYWRDWSSDVCSSDLVSSAYIRRIPNVTTLSVVATSPSGQPQYSFYAPDSADRALTPEALPSELPSEVNAIAAGSYALGVEPIASAIETLLRREAG